MSLLVFSFGGGVQSTAALVLAARGMIAYKTFIFSNVGANSENPRTLEYIEKYAKPFAAAHNLDLFEVAWVGKRGAKKGTTRDLYDDQMAAQRTIDIPVRLQGGGFGNRKCTARYKIEPVAEWTKAHGATAEDPAILGLGISWDESQRMGNSQTPHHVNDYPLIDLRLRRSDCERIISKAGLPVPPKSSCFFCPFKTAKDWKALRKDQPELFDRAITLENRVNEIRQELGKDDVFIGPGMKLTDIPDQLELDIFDGCESGFCHT